MRNFDRTTIAALLVCWAAMPVAHAEYAKLSPDLTLFYEQAGHGPLTVIDG